MPGGTEDPRPCPEPYFVWTDEYTSVNKNPGSTSGGWLSFFRRPYFVVAKRYTNVDGDDTEPDDKPE